MALVASPGEVGEETSEVNAGTPQLSRLLIDLALEPLPVERDLFDSLTNVFRIDHVSQITIAVFACRMTHTICTSCGCLACFYICYFRSD